MGRNCTGAVNEYSTIKIRLNKLYKPQSEKDASIMRFLAWQSKGDNLGSIAYRVCLSPESRYLELVYKLSDNDGHNQRMNYFIWLEGIPSNLGQGENLFFVCPITHERCKILYLCDITGKFCSRQGSRRNIRYTSQLYSKRDRINNYYFQLETLVGELESSQKKRHYRNQETRILKRIKTIKRKRDLFDERRLEYFNCIPLLNQRRR